MRKLKFLILAVVLLAIGYVIVTKPRKAKCEYPESFAKYNAELKAHHAGENAGFIDQDNLDNNVDVIKNKLGDRYKLRIVTKSLPSLDLLKYLMQKGNTNRLMVFSEPFIAELLTHFDADSLDLLLGKPLPADALTRLSAYKGYTTINWLVDTKDRLNDYLAFAKKQNVKLKLSVEIDVGLHRGGLETVAELADAAEVIKANNQYLQLTGLMGYDGHVPYVPFYINKERAIKRAFVNVQQSYTAFVDELKKHYDKKVIDSMTFNGGGSKTYFYYPEFKDITPINDIAVGSAFVTPAEYSVLLSLGHKPALFLASPVLKKMATQKLPHAEKVSPFVYMWNPNLQVSYYMLGGGFAGDPVAPTGIKKNPFYDADDRSTNMLPNQAMLAGSDENDMNVGDFIFYQPWEGDAMLTINNLLLFRQYKIVGEWTTYKGGN